MNFKPFMTLIFCLPLSFAYGMNSHFQRPLRNFIQMLIWIAKVKIKLLLSTLC